jgi:hypothetical protein
MKKHAKTAITLGIFLASLTTLNVSAKESEKDHHSSNKKHDAPLCLTINSGTPGGEIATSYLSVHSDGLAVGRECYVTGGVFDPIPYCVPVTGSVDGTYPHLQVSLAGNSTTTIRGNTTGIQTTVAIEYDLIRATGIGHAQTNTFKSNAYDFAVSEEVHSAIGSVERIACPKPTPNIIIRLPNCNTGAC